MIKWEELESFHTLLDEVTFKKFDGREIVTASMIKENELVYVVQFKDKTSNYKIVHPHFNNER